MTPVALITGASHGIGQETAWAFARAGYSLALSYFQGRESCAATAHRCKVLGSPAILTLRLDLGNDNMIRAFAEQVVAKFGSVSVLVNNAGISVRRPLRAQSFDEIDRQLIINLGGLIKLTQVCLPHVTETIINIGSGAGQRGVASLSTYCSSKFGVRGFTQALAIEVPHLRVVCVNPDATATRLHRDGRGRPPADVAEIVVRTATGELGTISGSDINVWDVD